MADFYILESAQEMGDLFFRTNQNEIAACIFQSEEAATSYVEARSKQAVWQVTRMAPSEAFIWLRHWQKDGLRELILNPAPDSDDSDQPVISVDAFTRKFGFEAEQLRRIFTLVKHK
jgi:hypothetical protein